MATFIAILITISAFTIAAFKMGYQNGYRKAKYNYQDPKKRMGGGRKSNEEDNDSEYDRRQS